jgi:hypothetical protein
MSGVSRTEVSVQVFVHVRGFQWEQSRMYVGCSGNSRVCTWVAVGTVAYICTYFFWVGAGPYRLTGDINRSYRWSATDLWEEDISRIFVEVWFF